MQAFLLQSSCKKQKEESIIIAVWEKFGKKVQKHVSDNKLLTCHWARARAERAGLNWFRFLV